MYACAYISFSPSYGTISYCLFSFDLLFVFLFFFFFVTVVVMVVIRVMVTHKGRSVGNLIGNWPGKGLFLHKVLKHWSLRQDEFFQF